MSLNPIDHPICLSAPHRIAVSAWTGHTPFAMYLVSAARPRVIVELGTFTGVSYCAFCQAVKELQLDTRCYGIDTWLGDEQTGFYESNLLEDLKQHHDQLYADFSTLVQATFDEARAQFPDRSIDLLHIDGAHQYESVRHDFESWLPKMSGRGIVLIHDIGEHKDGFGVWQFWSELKTRFPSFEFHHEHGLGVLAVGAEIPNEVQFLFDGNQVATTARVLFQELGARLILARDGEAARCEHAATEDRARALDQHARNLEHEIQARDTIIDNMRDRLAMVENRVNAITNSRSWKLIDFYGRAKRVVTSPRIAFSRRAANGAGASTYSQWVKQYGSLNEEERSAIMKRIEGFSSKPKLLLVVWPLASMEALSQTVTSLRNQLYDDWELWIVQAETGEVPLSVLDSRVRLLECEPGEHSFNTINRVAETSDAEFIGFIRPGDQLAEEALYLAVEEINRFAAIDVIYSDEDAIDEDGRRSDPYFKPDWNPDLQTSGDYLTSFVAYRSSLFKSLGGLLTAHATAALYDLSLRASEHIAAVRIRHLPYVLYHRCKDPVDSANERQMRDAESVKVLNDHFQRLGVAATATNSLPAIYRAHYEISNPPPLVSLIIPTRDRVELLRTIVTGILERTEYRNFEVLIVDNQSSDHHALSYFAEISELPNVSVISYDQPFNFSAINNFAVRQSKGQIIGFLNSDLEVISPGWLTEMVSHALRPEVGAVGAKLFYPNDTIQHAGIILGLGNLAGYVHRHAPRSAMGHGLRLQKIQNVAAVTAACMLMRRSVFDQVGGFDEVNLPVAYNDVDLCLRVRESGYRIVWTPYAELCHAESASRSPDRSPNERARYERECAYLKTRWGSELARDPYYNPNLTIEAEDFSLAWPPRLLKPWLY